MGTLELLLLAVGLAMDAFAVAICKGLALEKISWKEMAIVGAWFGIFQGLMPAIGWLLGSAFEQYIVAFDHWIAFILLSLIGINMIREALSKEEECADCSLGFRAMLVLAIATSIDALAVGISLAMVSLTICKIVVAMLSIFVFTALASYIGLNGGRALGDRLGNKPEILGGAILVAIGVKILLEHLVF